MKIFITGVACVGGTTIGQKLAERLKFDFYDFVSEVEKYFNLSIERLKNQHFTERSFREEKGSVVLKHIISTHQNENFVVALPPSGLMDAYYRILKNLDCTTIVLRDKAENILMRITFYDIDSNRIDVKLTAADKAYYLDDIRKDMKYFGRTHTRAHISVDIAGLNIEESVAKVLEQLSF